jgi:hypothetical protein
VNPRKSVARFLGAYQRSDFLADDNFADIPAMIEIENDDRQVVVFAQRNGVESITLSPRFSTSM